MLNNYDIYIFIHFFQRITWDPKLADQELCLLKGKQEVSNNNNNDNIELT